MQWSSGRRRKKERRAGTRLRLEGLLAMASIRSRSRGTWLASGTVVGAGSSLPPGGVARPRRRVLGGLRRPRRWRWILGPLVLLTLLAAGSHELRTSDLQAWVLSSLDHRLTFHLAPGPNPALPLPPDGPYDARLGYSRVGTWTARLAQRGFRVTEQTRFSEALTRAVALGLSPPYREPSQTGLRIYDRDGRILFLALHPDRVYPEFAAIPPLVVRSLLFIENRELLDAPPRHNPAVEWDRLARASFDLVRSAAAGEGDRHGPGGSTLATQLEKYRHSSGGLTASPLEKLRQIASASLRAYLDGENTSRARRRIVLDYLNSLPLAARPGRGEVLGLAAGLEAWYGADFDRVNTLLSAPPALDAPDRLAAQGLAYRQVLSLLLATRRPSAFLREQPLTLGRLTDAYLRRLASAGVVPDALRDAAEAARVAVVPADPRLDPDRISGRDAARPVRRRLAAALGLDGYYALDRLDLEVGSTLDASAQEAIGRRLEALRNRSVIARDGLAGRGLLQTGDPSRVVYSFALYERVGHANLLRVEADTADSGLDVHEDTKLDLGSTAKLRVLATYLGAVAEIHDHLAGDDARALRERARRADPLTAFVAEWMARHPDGSLHALLAAAMQRRYSASPAEAFFTGGGIHRFRNFDREEDQRVYTVGQAFAQSVNLVFIRLMRDLVTYYEVRLPGNPLAMLHDPHDPRRTALLERFAREDGRTRLAHLYRQLAGVPAEVWVDRWARTARPAPRRLARVLCSVEPSLGPDAFVAAMRRFPAAAEVPEATLRRLHAECDPARWSLADRAYLTGVQPLELWLVGWLQAHPNASFAETLAASPGPRREAYAWLFATRNRHAQDRRIRIMIERDAFAHIHDDWKRLGYPFDSLVPSYATAIGSSADRPSALAELLGIISAGGVRYPVRRIQELRFGPATPYETVLEPVPAAGERVMRPAVARTLRQALLATVAGGTARRAAGSLVAADGEAIPVGGKTGTGDNEFKNVDRDGRVIDARPVSRTATFVFLFGDRYFGVITAYVSGRRSGAYDFTSSLPVQVFADLGPELVATSTRALPAVASPPPRPEPSPEATGSPTPPARTPTSPSS